MAALLDFALALIARALLVGAAPTLPEEDARPHLTDFEHIVMQERNYSASAFVINSTEYVHTADLSSESVQNNHYLLYILVGSAVALIAGIVLAAAILVLWRRRKTVFLPEHSIYGQQDSVWDNLSLNYIDNPNEMVKDSWESLSDDSYLASLDEAISRHASIAFQKRQHNIHRVSQLTTPPRGAPIHRFQT